MTENFDFKENEPLKDEEIVSSPFDETIKYVIPPEAEEKMELKRSANTAGVSLLLLMGLTVIAGIFMAIFSLFTGGRAVILEEPAIAQVYQAVYSIFVFTVPFVCCYKIAGFRISDLVSFEKGEKGIAIPLFFMGIAFSSFANIGASAVDSFFEGIGIDYSVADIDYPEGVFGFILTLIAVAVVPALVEEFALRGVILGSLRKFGDSFAIIASAVCFGVLHGNFEQMPFAIMMGLFLGFATVKTGNLWVAVAVHFVNNLISVIFTYFPSSVPTEIQNTVYIFYLFIAFVIGLLFLRKAPKGLFSLEKAQTLNCEKTKYKTFFLSGGVIVFVILNLIEAFSFIFI